VRGGIARGKHVQQNLHERGDSRHHVFAVSEALVRAAAEERRKEPPPCGITLDESSITLEEISAFDLPEYQATQRAVLFRNRRWIVNPFSAGIIRWAKPRLDALLSEYRGTSHSPKYEWMLDLLNDVSSNQRLRAGS